MNLSQYGLSTRVPVIRPRYYNPEVFGGTDGRGAVASIRLLNSKTSSSKKLSGTELKIFEQLISRDGYTEFLLQNVSFSDTEKTQIMHTFGDGYVNYFYGRNPRQMSLSGILIDDLDNDWFYKFLVAYDKFLRGTSLAKNYRMIQLTLPNMVLVGSILDLSYSQDANNDSTVSFSMNFVIKSMSFISSRSVNDTPATVNNVFKLSPTGTDYATLSKSEIDRRIGASLLSAANQLGVSQDIVAQLSINSGFAVMSNERAQSLFGAFASGATFNKLTKWYTEKKEALLTRLKPVLSFVKRVTTALDNITNFFRNLVSQIYSITQFFSGIPNLIASFTQKLLGPLKALLNAPNALQSIVYSVKLIKDSVVQSLSNIKNTFKEVTQVFTNARAAIFSAPDTFAAKLSAGSAAGEFQSTTSLGSVTANVIDSEAVAVLQLLNSRDAETFSTLESPENAVNAFEFSSVVSL